MYFLKETEMADNKMAVIQKHIEFVILCAFVSITKVKREEILVIYNKGLCLRKIWKMIM